MAADPSWYGTAFYRKTCVKAPFKLVNLSSLSFPGICSQLSNLLTSSGLVIHDRCIHVYIIRHVRLRDNPGLVSGDTKSIQ
jgi:hypothetical protein